jgi:hypothetical protein
MAVTRFGHRTLPAMVAGRVLRGNQPQAFPQFSWVLTTRQVADVGHHGDGHDAWHTPQGLEGLDHEMQAPRLHLCLQFRFAPLEVCGRLMNRTDVCLKDDVLNRCQTDDCREPPQVGWAPIGPARISDILSEQEGFETELGILEIADSVFTRPGEVADGFIFCVWDRDQGEIA